MDYNSKLERENLQLRNIIGSFDNNEQEIERAFLYYIAQEEDLSGEIGQLDGKKPQGINDAVSVDGEKNEENPESMTESDEQEIEDILASEDNKTADVLEWNNFSIQQNKEFANKLQQEQGLSLDDALKQSYYIEYRNPKDKELLAVQGSWFGFKREEDGEGIKFMGGYGMEDKIGKDLEYMKDSSESGFPVDKKDILVTLDKLSPALQAFKEKKEQDNIVDFSNEEKQDKEGTEELGEELEKAPIPSIEKPIKSQKPQESQKSRTEPTPSIPKPVGRVSKEQRENYFKRQSRLETIRLILGKKA